MRKYGQGVSGGLFGNLRMRKFSKLHGTGFVGGRAAHLDAIPAGSRSVGEGCSLFVSSVWGSQAFKIGPSSWERERRKI